MFIIYNICICRVNRALQSPITSGKRLGSVVDVALASEAEGRGFNPRLDARFLLQHVDLPINWVVTWLWSIVKHLELLEIRRFNIYFIYFYVQYVI